MTTDYNEVADSSALARYGVSDELMGMFDSLRETPGLAGNKFRADEVNALAQSVICRNYGKACLELSYLLFAVVQQPIGHRRHSPLLDFFWLAESITPRRFRLAFAATEQKAPITPVKNALATDALVSMGKDFLHIHIDNTEFAISPTRVGYLAVLFEFLVNISPDIVQTAEEQLSGANLKQLKTFSSDVQKTLYGYLNDHLAPAQQQRRFRFLSQWLKAKEGQALIKDSVNDEVVLAFWQEMVAEQEDGLGFRRYRTVVENFVSLLQALEVGNSKREVEHAAAIGYDTEQGEIHPEQLDDLLSAREDMVDIHWLADSPKFISKQQLQWLEPVMAASFVIEQLPLSVVRMRLFGDWQAELLQAVRGGDENTIKAKLSKDKNTLYDQYQQDCEGLSHALSSVRLAIVHILTELKQTAALQPMAQFMSHQDWADIKQTLLAIRQEVLTEQQGKSEPAGPALVEQITALFFNRLDQYRLQHPGVNRLLQQAKTAFKANNRQGFKQLPAVHDLSDYEQGFETLGLCRSQLKQLLQQIQPLFSSPGHSLAKSVADLAIFHSTFEQMYLTTVEVKV